MPLDVIYIWQVTPQRQGQAGSSGLSAPRSVPWESDDGPGFMVRRLRVVAVRGAWMQAASWGVISFFTLSRSMGKIFCTNASSCCLNSRAGYLASTCSVHAHTVQILLLRQAVLLEGACQESFEPS